MCGDRPGGDGGVKFTVTRLCGGKALMMVPRHDLLLDMDGVVDILQGMAEDVRKDGMMVLCSWRGMEMTVYEQGKVMFFPLQERAEGIALATEVLGILSPAARE